MAPKVRMGRARPCGRQTIPPARRRSERWPRTRLRGRRPWQSRLLPPLPAASPRRRTADTAVRTLLPGCGPDRRRIFWAFANACTARSRAASCPAVSLVTAARTAAVAASRKAAGSVPPLALRIDWSIDAKGSELRASVGATTWAAVCAVEPSVCAAPPATVPSVRKAPPTIAPTLVERR